MVGGVTDFIVTADPCNDGIMFSVVEQLVGSHNAVVAMVTRVIAAII